MSGIDDQRMKDLADRLVAMSPEPPPFPEEFIVTQPTNPKRNPVLIFAGAAALVLILAAIPFFLARGGGEVDPVATTTTSSVPSTQGSTVTSTTQAESTTTSEAVTSTTVPLEAKEAVVYLIQDPENSFTGNPALVPFRTVVPAPASTSPNLLSLQLVTGDLALPTGFTTMIPAEVDVIGARVTEHLITIDMNQAFLDGAGGLLADFTMLNQLIYTAAQVGEVMEVRFTVGGEPVTAFGSEGLDLSQPVGIGTYLDQLNSIIVTIPVNGIGAEPLVVYGFANVFEANLSYEVLEGDGTVVREDFTTASCGTGCWGGFSFEVQYDFSGDETVRVFEVSMEDGSPTNVVTVPILWDDEDGWDLITGS